MAKYLMTIDYDAPLSITVRCPSCGEFMHDDLHDGENVIMRCKCGERYSASFVISVVPLPDVQHP